MNFLPEEIEAYAEMHSTQEPDALQALNRETWANTLIPRMLSGHLQGRILSMLSHMQKPKQILEIGTFTGYSAICLAEGLQAGGMLHTIDINDEMEEMIHRHIRAAGFAESIKVYTGNALDIIPTLPFMFDMVFIDADKENYSRYYDLVFDKLQPGAIIIADNVLWSGKVLQKYQTLDEETKALVDYVQKVQADNRVENVLLPVRDGLMIARKK